MRFGFFDQLPCAGGYSERQRYRDLLAQIELGEALGFDTVWLGELHFSRGVLDSRGSADGAGRGRAADDAASAWARR